MSKDYSIGVITNDIYTKEDAEFLHKNSILPMERIVGVETGGCPHTAIREDASMNLEAVDELANKFLDLDIIFIESGGDNLSATFSPELSDATIIIVAQRISTIMHAKQIIVLDDGEIVGKGTHKELMQNCEVYKEIALSQLSEEEVRNNE